MSAIEDGIGTPTAFALVVGMLFVAAIASLAGYTPLYGVLVPVIVFGMELLFIKSLQVGPDQ